MGTTVAAALGVILVLQALTFSSARLSKVDLSLGPGRVLSEFKDEKTVLGIELKHAFHVDSPQGKLGLTSLEKVQLMAKSSKARLNRFAQKTGSGTQVFTSPVEHDPYGSALAYNMNITLGTPPLTYQSTLDTGSDLIWVQCEPCDYCFNETAPIFDPTASSTYSNISCTADFCKDLPTEGQSCSPTKTCLYTYEYGDDSVTSGELAYEQFTLLSGNGSTSPFKLAFGCGIDNEGLFNGSDGIVGLGRGPLSLVSQLGPDYVPVFSYCLVDFDAAQTNTSLLLLGSAGTLTLTQTPLIQNSFYPTFYYVNITAITVNNKSVDFPADTFKINSDGSGGTILDSGTTLTYIPDGAYTPFSDAVNAIITYPLLDPSIVGLDNCYNITGVTDPTFPVDATFSMESLTYEAPSANLFYLFSGQFTSGQEIDIGCLIVQSSGDIGISIIGNIMQQNHQVAYDVVNNQVGFAQTTC